jgi:hypothetical protein
VMCATAAIGHESRRFAAWPGPVQPFGGTVNPRTGTFYVTQPFRAGSMSVLSAARP